MPPTVASSLADAGIDALACKPASMDPREASTLGVELLAVDYEGREHVPPSDLLADLAEGIDIRLTVPIRADGYDPLGDDSLLASVPDSVGLVAVAGNPAYLDGTERSRAVAPRLRTLVDGATDPWVGSEGIERIAMVVGGTQYDLLSGRTERDARALRAAGFTGGLAVYAPAVFSDEPDAILDAVGRYAGRRRPVRRALPDDCTLSSAVTGEARETLLAACRDYALVGEEDTVARQVDQLTAAGVDRIVAYPARGIDVPDTAT
ncbi:MAG: luciferase [Salinirussus sp.]